MIFPSKLHDKFLHLVLTLSPTPTQAQYNIYCYDEDELFSSAKLSITGVIFFLISFKILQIFMYRLWYHLI